MKEREFRLLKQLLQFPTPTLTAEVWGVWPAKEYLQYSTMMLYHGTVNSEKEQIAKSIVKEQHKYN